MYTDFLVDAKTFIEVIKLGSISALSERDGEHRKTISKRISRIQEYFSSELVKINNGKMQLTKEGQAIFINLKRILSGLNYEVKSLAELTSKSKQRIKFLNSADIYAAFGSQIISELLQKNPDLSIEAKIYTQYQLTNFGIMLKTLTEDSDIVALWDSLLYLIDDQKWIIKKRFTTKKYIYASPEYIQKNPNITELSDITSHQCITNSYEESDYWDLQSKLGDRHKVDINIRAAVDTFSFQLELIENGLGIGLVPNSIADSSPRNITRIFPNFSTARMESSLLIKKDSLEKKPYLKEVVNEIDDILSSMPYWND